MRRKDMFADMAIEELRRQIEHFCHLGDRVLDQTRRRVMDGEQVPTTDQKIHSICRPYRPDQRRQGAQPVEFGHKVFLAESARPDHAVRRAEGDPADEVHVASSLQRHRQALAWPRSCMARIAASSVTEPGIVQARWRQAGVHSAAGRQENTAARSVREQRRVREWSALSRWHRGPHLGAVPRPRHKALSRRRTRPLRTVGRRRRDRQQPHENRGTPDGSVASQTKSCLTDAQVASRQIRTGAAQLVSI